MKRFLQMSGLILALAAGLTWLALGANRGWTKTSVPVKTVDDVTGLEGITYQRRFVPGVDLLGGTWLVSATLLGLSLIFRKDKNQTNKHETSESKTV